VSGHRHYTPPVPVWTVACERATRSLLPLVGMEPWPSSIWSVAVPTELSRLSIRVTVGSVVSRRSVKRPVIRVFLKWSSQILELCSCPTSFTLPCQATQRRMNHAFNSVPFPALGGSYDEGAVCRWSCPTRSVLCCSRRGGHMLQLLAASFRNSRLQVRARQQGICIHAVRNRQHAGVLFPAHETDLSVSSPQLPVWP
jgi:hypothetical protein